MMAATTPEEFDPAGSLDAKLSALAPLRQIDVPDFRELVEEDPMALTIVVNTAHVDGTDDPSEQAVLTAVVDRDGCATSSTCDRSACG